MFCTISGYGMTGPYKDMPSHGIAYDVWAGLVKPETTEDGFCAIPEHPSMGIHAGPLFGALGVLAGIVGARATGEGCRLEIAQSDAAAAMDWLRSETWKAYERPESEVTGNKSDDYARRAPGTAGMRDGVRYQFYETSDGHILFLASEREFWENFCRGIGRADLFEAHPGSQYADHARRRHRAAAASCRTIFRRPHRPPSGSSWATRSTRRSCRSTRPRRWPTTRSSRTGCRGSPRSWSAPTRCRTPLKFLDAELPDADQGADRRPAHRRGAARRARLRRRAHRRTCEPPAHWADHHPTAPVL